MTETNAPLREARALPNGAKFYRCAFQVNPASYAAKFRGNGHGLDERTYVQKLLDKCVELDIEVIAVTDHNDAGSIALFREEAKPRNITVFPGFEVASSEGVHVLCIYPPDATDAALQRYLGEIGITTAEPSSSLSKKSFADLLECVRTQGGLTIAAHITQDKGLLNTLHGQARVQAWRDSNLLCVQIPGSVEEAPDDKRPILKNQNADYKREVGPDATTALAIVNAGDVAKPEDLDLATSTCWVKMTEPSLEGLRQAFLDPVSRIRLASDPVPEAHAEFVGLAWQGGFLDGRAVSFNENLNVLIGGRGTGKSTVIESLRYVLGLDPLGEDAKKAHEGIVKHVLKSGTRIALSVRVHHPARREYVIERTVPNAPVVKDSADQPLPYKPADVIPRAQVFGQHEISELTKDGEKLTRLLDRFIASDDAAQVNKGEKKQGLADSRKLVADAADKLTKFDEKLAALPKLEETLKRFQEAGLEEKMKDKSLLIREEQLLKQADGVVGRVRQLASTLRAATPLDVAFLDTISDALPSAEKLRRLKATFATLQLAVEQAAKSIDDAVSVVDAERVAFQTGWDAHKKTVEETYEKTLRELQKAKIDGEEFVRLKKQIEELRPLRDQRTVLEKRLAGEREVRRTKLVEWENAKAEQFRSLEKAAKKVTKQLEGRVRVRVSFAAVRDQLIALLKEKVGGRLSEALETLRTVDQLSLSELATAGRSGKDALVTKYSLLPAQAEKLAQATESVWMEVEELDLPATTTIELNTAPEGEDAVWRKLDDLSTGQKATAVLLLLLLESDAPLVVDQPEDDLDNRFITESIVPKMREEKRRRQFVFATHNANIPVLGDAELIVGLAARNDGNGALTAKHMGAIDSRGVRELVEEVLEGGRRAFELRRQKYGF
ncbi:MAG: phosphoesterase [Polyangiaceae bacterium UTPRO1]|jgi:energy-coupling factor transporter ATP-binding protein EcfA2|nr:phosphoesterase [Myxococcales bacterium]OQY64792.1 MAG: phosphoesterase [Polyangiaceae bacterium UTPRO1]